MSMRDLVENCSDDPNARRSNPVLNMVDMFLGGKDGFQERWTPEHSFQMPQTMNNIPPWGMSEKINSFTTPNRQESLENFGQFNQLFDQISLQGPKNRMPAYDYNRQQDQFYPLTDYFRDFIHSFHTNQNVNLTRAPQVNINPIDKQKIRNRTSILARHLNPNEDFVESQVKTLHHALNIADNNWTMRKSLSTPQQNQQLSKWTNEFSNFNHNNFAEFEKYFHAPRNEKSLGWVEQFNKPADFDKVYNQIEETEKWVNEFGVSDYSRQPSMTDWRSLTEQARSINDPKLQESDFMKFLNKLSDGQLSIANNKLVENAKNDWVEDYKKGGYEEKSEKWMEDFEKWTKLQGKEDWIDDYTKFAEDDSKWAQEFETFSGNTAFEAENNGEYEFQKDNPFIDDANAFEKGLKLFEEGNIPEAILAFEASVQKDPNFSRAWQYLGKAQAENDKDDLAINALTKAVASDPKNLDALLNLGVSYTNDFHKDKAIQCLIQWLEAHNDYAPLLKQIKLPDGSYDIRHEAVTEVFLNAARIRANNPDPEVQTVLGVLFNLSFEFSKAIDCFRTALAIKPNDYLLWNKLGATQANGSDSASALEAYYRALKIKPTYTRARTNLGISFMLQNNYVEAAKSFLGALSINPKAQHIWDYLNKVFIFLRRGDLSEKIQHHDVSMFRDEFVF
eukprot:TRINITY_DN2690_c0_g1_i2.p1 TRINITY_DN2690_c0_g1~~TRINITY_DN2690_c0_g1_i2.p1  ORF type:complete len:712 (-),score=133.57 TRINITY_DN2690_c0_g1_i2:101-2128(-)